MTLSASSLKSALRPMFSPAGMPKSAVDAVRQWSAAYASYAQSALAGGTSPAALSPAPVPGAFFQALEQTLRAMWMSVAWAGPALVGVTAVVPPLSPIMQSVGASQMANRDPEKALSAFTDALHTYTLGITVTVTTPAGVSSVVPVT